MMVAVSRHTSWVPLENSVAYGIKFSVEISISFSSVNTKFSTLSCFLTDAWHFARRIYLEEIIKNILNHYPLTDYCHTHAVAFRMFVMVMAYRPLQFMSLYLIVLELRFYILTVNSASNIMLPVYSSCGFLTTESRAAAILPNRGCSSWSSPMGATQFMRKRSRNFVKHNTNYYITMRVPILENVKFFVTRCCLSLWSKVLARDNI
jgi:hypothetical protein